MQTARIRLPHRLAHNRKILRKVILAPLRADHGAERFDVVLPRRQHQSADIISFIGAEHAKDIRPLLLHLFLVTLDRIHSLPLRPSLMDLPPNLIPLPHLWSQHTLFDVGLFLLYYWWCIHRELCSQIFDIKEIHLLLQEVVQFQAQ